MAQFPSHPVPGFQLEILFGRRPLLFVASRTNVENGSVPYSLPFAPHVLFLFSLPLSRAWASVRDGDDLRHNFAGLTGDDHPQVCPLLLVPSFCAERSAPLTLII
jgi:hypothetical protein